MVNSAIQAELMKQLERLSEAQQQQLLGYARALMSAPDTQPAASTTSTRSVMHLFGVLSPKEAEKMRNDIEEDCERIDPNGW